LRVLFFLQHCAFVNVIFSTSLAQNVDEHVHRSIRRDYDFSQIPRASKRLRDAMIVERERLIANFSYRS